MRAVHFQRQQMTHQLVLLYYLVQANKNFDKACRRTKKYWCKRFFNFTATVQGRCSGSLHVGCTACQAMHVGYTICQAILTLRKLCRNVQTLPTWLEAWYSLLEPETVHAKTIFVHQNKLYHVTLHSSRLTAHTIFIVKTVHLNYCK